MTEPGYDTVDVADALEALAELSGARPLAAARRVVAAPQRAAPPVLMSAAAVLFAAGERATGAFWFYAGQLRARVDATLATDPSAAAACGALRTAYGAPINRWAFLEEPGVLPGLVDRVAAWDAATPYDYDRRWIALHGMNAYLGVDGPLIIPFERWEPTAARVRREFVASLHDLFDADGRLRTELLETGDDDPA